VPADGLEDVGDSGDVEDLVDDAPVVLSEVDLEAGIWPCDPSVTCPKNSGFTGRIWKGRSPLKEKSLGSMVGGPPTGPESEDIS